MLGSVLRRTFGISQDCFRKEVGSLSIFQFLLKPTSVYSYLLLSAGRAALIDPIYFTQQYQQVARQHGAEVSDIFLTHEHADYVYCTSLFQARLHSHLAAKFPSNKLQDGQRVGFGQVELELLHTPGHTKESSCYLVWQNQKPLCLFSGDTILMGEVGRPYRAERESGFNNVGQLYKSIQRIKTLPGSTLLFPGHGPDSFCSKAIESQRFSTVGQQLKSNFALRTSSEQELRNLLSKYSPYEPNYFCKDKPGRREFQPVPAQEAATRKLTLLDITAIPDELEDILLYKSDKVPVLRLPLNRMFQKNAGYFVEQELKFVLVGRTMEELREAEERLFLIGLNSEGYLLLNAKVEQDLGLVGRPVQFITVEQLVRAKNNYRLVDVRSAEEKLAGKVPGSLSIEMGEIQHRVKELEHERRELVAHCRAGSRAMYALFYLVAKGFEVKICVENVKKIIELLE